MEINGATLFYLLFLQKDKLKDQCEKAPGTNSANLNYYYSEKMPNKPSFERKGA